MIIILYHHSTRKNTTLLHKIFSLLIIPYLLQFVKVYGIISSREGVSTTLAMLIATGSFILFDIITGIIKALYNEGLNSTLLRKGLFHKLSEVLAVVGSALLELGIEYIDLGIDLPLLGIVGAYICLMEFVSIVENLCEVNPILKKLFKPYLEKIKGEKDDNEL